MKILIIAPVIFPCGLDRYQGIERLVSLWSRELSRLGNSVTVASAQGSVFPREIAYIEAPRGDFVQGEQIAYSIYKRFISSFELILDFSHSHFAMREAGLRAVCWIWHDPGQMQPPLPAYNVCALSKWQAKQLFYFQGIRAEVLDPHCGAIGIPDWCPTSFLYIGRPHPTKGMLDAAEICRELNMPLDIIGALGPGDDRAYLEKVLNIAKNSITYWGDVSDSGRIELTRRAKALIYPLNYEEAHSHKIVDCLLCGIPVVAYNRGAFPEIIEHGIDGFLADNRQEFKKYMSEVDGLDRQLIRKRAIERWSVENTVKRALPVLKGVAKEELRW